MMVMTMMMMVMSVWCSISIADGGYAKECSHDCCSDFHFHKIIFWG